MRLLYQLPVRVVPAFLSFTPSIDRPQQLGLENEVKAEKVTGWKAVAGIFERDEWGDMKPEFASIISTTSFAVLAGSIYGGIIKSRGVYEDFIRNNHATAFHSHLEAKRSLQTKVTLSFGKGAFYYGWRTGLFTSMYASYVNSVSLYRGKSGILEYCTGGILVGMLFRFHLGLSGAVTGAALGGVLGFIGGLISVSLLKLSGVSFDDLKNADFEWQKMRSDAFKDAAWKSLREDTEPVLAQKVDEFKKTGQALDSLNTVEGIKPEDVSRDSKEKNHMSQDKSN